MQQAASNSSSLNELSISKLGGPCAVYAQTVKVQNCVFSLDKRYEIIEVLGTGAYGVVISAVDSTTGEKIAIKKIEKAFDHPIFTKRTLRELRIMRLLDNSNVLGTKGLQLPKSYETLNEIYVMMELMDTDLSSIIKSDQELTDDHVQFFLYQLLRGAKFMHSAKILHRDLKPRNLLVNANCDLKICDFGLARAEQGNYNVKTAQMTDYVATRWYRAPECLFSFRQYTSAIDVWSIGCILGELLLRRPLLPGNDTQHQIKLIFNLVGTPSNEDIERIPNPKSREKVRAFPSQQSPTIDAIFADQNPAAVDLLKKMLKFDVAKRISVEEALNHPYMSQLHFEEDEPTAEPVSRFDFQFEESKTDGEVYKRALYEEILYYHFQEKQEEYKANKTQYLSEFGNFTQNPVNFPAEGDSSDEEEDLG